MALYRHMATIDSLPPAKEIPSAFVSSVKSWWAAGEKQASISEERLLRRLPFFSSSSTHHPASPDSTPVVTTSTRVNLDSPKHYINTVSITPTNPSPHPVPAAVLLHGYGAGLGFYFRNLPVLANWAGKRGTPVHAIDWLGMGRSARVPFTVRARREDITSRVHEAESFFVESLEEWRNKMGLEKMTLIGHSLGAYFSVVYALRYPDRVSRLVLLSPAGVPRGPNYTQLSRELTDEGSGAPRQSTKANVENATKDKVDEIREEQREHKRNESRTRRLFTYLWEEGWSPFQVVRATMFWGPMLIGKYSSRRFSGLSEEETRDLHEYIMNITLAKGSGEYCISHILEPGAHARMPLVDRIDKLKIPVTFVYGDHDWMDPQGGEQSVERLRQAGNGKGKMYLVSNAGHHVYLDNHTAINQLLVKELEKEYEKAAESSRFASHHRS